MDQELIEMLGKLPSSEFEDILRNALEKGDDDAAQELLVLRMATDVELYAVLFFPHYCELEFNQFHLDLFKAFKFGERKIRRVRAAPRGSAKSTIATLIRPIHDACYATETFILFVSSTEELANAKLKDIRAEVLSNTDLQDWFGVRFPQKKVAESSFTIISDNGETHFRSSGKGSQVRGIRHKQHRPTKLVFDDYETSAESSSEILRKKDEATYHEEFGKTGNQFTNIEYVGTALHNEGLLKKLIQNPAYDANLYKAIISWSVREDLWEQWRKIYRNIDNPNRAIDALAFFKAHEAEMLRETKVLWPEKESYYDHMLDMEEIGKRAFFKEKQNEPLGTDTPLFEQIHWYHEVDGGVFLESTKTFIAWERLKHSCYGSMDPSTGQNKPKKGKQGDWSVLPTGYKCPKGRLLVHHDITSRISPTKQIEAIFNNYEQFEYAGFAVETNLYRNLLLPNIIAERKRREKEKKGEIIKVPFYDVVQTENKAERIFRLEPKVNHGMIVFNRALSQPFKNMIQDYPDNDHDDAPDAVEILWNLVNGRYKASPLSIDNMGD